MNKTLTSFLASVCAAGFLFAAAGAAVSDDNERRRARIGFVIELARRLHQYGAAAPRLEQAVGNVAQQLGFACDVLSTPTSIVIIRGFPWNRSGVKLFLPMSPPASFRTGQAVLFWRFDGYLTKRKIHGEGYCRTTRA